MTLFSTESKLFSTNFPNNCGATLRAGRVFLGGVAGVTGDGVPGGLYIAAILMCAHILTPLSPV